MRLFLELNTAVSIPAPPTKRSLPKPPFNLFAPLLPLIVFAELLPVPFIFSEPVSIKFSQLSPKVQSVEA